MNQETSGALRRLHRCRLAGCRALATCLPRLFVPSHKLSYQHQKAIGAIMGLPLCDQHFKLVTPADFLKDASIRDSIGRDFEKALALPDFSGAWIGRCERSEKDFTDWEFYAERAAARGESGEIGLN